MILKVRDLGRVSWVDPSFHKALTGLWVVSAGEGPGGSKTVYSHSLPLWCRWMEMGLARTTNLRVHIGPIPQDAPE